MPRLRAAGYKYAALPDVVGEKSPEEIERAELEATWKQKTADMWANAELEVPQAQARRVQQRERKAGRAVTVPLPPRAGATSPTRERRKITTASPSRDGRRVAAKKHLQGQQLEDRSNRGPSSGGDQPVPGAKQLPITAKAWKAKNHAARSTKTTTKAASKKKKKKKKKKKRVSKRTKATKLPTNDESVEPASQLMLHEISVGRLGSGGLGRLKHGRPSPVQEQSDEAARDEDFASSSAESKSESASEFSDSDSAAGDASVDGPHDAGDPRHHGMEAAAGFSDLERQFRSVEASLPAAERAVLADDFRSIAGTISSMSQQQSTFEITKVTERRADQVRTEDALLQADGGYVANSENNESRQSWSESSDDDRDDDRNHEPVPRRDGSQWKLHTDVASGEQFEIHSITQEVRWLGAETNGSDLDARRGTSDTISKGGGPSSARKSVNKSRGPRRSSYNRATSKPRRHAAPKQQHLQPHQANAERSRARTSRTSRKSPGSVRQSTRPSDAKAPRRKKVQPRQSAVHDSGEWGGVETAEERQLRMKAERRKEQELRRPVAVESESESSYDDDDGHSDSDRSHSDSDRSQSSAEMDRSQSSAEMENYESDSVDSTSDKAPQNRGRRSKRGQGQKVPSERREKSLSRPVKDFDLREPAGGGSRAGRRRGSNDGIFGAALGDDDEPEALVALEERWQEWWDNEPEEPLVGNGSAKDFEKRMADYLHRKRLQETTSAIDVSAPVKPCWHYTQAGDLKKRRQNREKELEIAQHATRVKASMAKIAAKVPGGGHGVGSRPASKPPRTLRPLDTHAVGTSNRRTGEGTGDERRWLSERVFQHTSKPPPPAPPWYVSKLR